MFDAATPRELLRAVMKARAGAPLLLHTAVATDTAPRDIDEVLYAHPDVVEAAAFARPCKSYGERVEAAVAIRPGVSIVSEDLQRFCEERLGAFKTPDRVHVLDELPKGPSGKIQRLKLAELIPLS